MGHVFHPGHSELHGITVVVYVPDDLPPEVAHRARSLGWPSQTRLRSV